MHDALILRVRATHAQGLGARRWNRKLIPKISEGL